MAESDDIPAFDPGSKARLTPYDRERFAGDTVFARIARQVCEAGCLPRKELYESWEVARRTRRLFRGGRIVDLAGGHGLLAQMLWVLDRASPEALVLEPNLPASHEAVHQRLCDVWPALAGRVRFVRADLDAVTATSADLLVSSHACGGLTDRILDLAVEVRARVVVLPCCHALDGAEMGSLRGWMDGPLAVDVMRVMRLRAAGYRVWTQTIPAAITPKNRLILAAPSGSADATNE